MKKILLVDDHLIFAEGLKNMLTGKGYHVCDILLSGQDLQQKIQELHPDLLILDLNMPGIDGMECLRLTQKEHPNVKVIILSMHDEISFVLSALRLGAQAYVLKNNSWDELIAAIQSVENGEVYQSVEVKSKIIENAILKEKKQKKGMIPKLTMRENEILQMIYQEYTTQEIADKLCLSTHTIETHRRHLFNKFDVRNSIGLIKKALSYGLLQL
ncbi:MAG: response regulator transcription factor [Cyclobacteriaceae bacterium]|nr:response regulator transcription factor [Cyclobacteriaceae bacterium]